MPETAESAHLKEGELAAEAGERLSGTGWLLAILRTAAPAPTEEPALEALAAG
jgi:hypothetical protein